jgi:hypothetical protein
MLAVAVTASCAPPPRVVRPRTPPYVIADSLMSWPVGMFQHELAKRWPGAVVNAASCRGLVRSCTAPAVPVLPPSGLETIRALRGKLGELVVLELGYNDFPALPAFDQVMAELHSQGVDRVVWVSLSERRPTYRPVNAALFAARAKWPEIRILDWRAASAGTVHDAWFIDGVHLTPAGKAAFAAFLGAGLARVD